LMLIIHHLMTFGMMTFMMTLSVIVLRWMCSQIIIFLIH
jgi:hypothetical protein